MFHIFLQKIRNYKDLPWEAGSLMITSARKSKCSSQLLLAYSAVSCELN